MITSDFLMNGIIVIDKPSGMTSHDVVALTRRIISTRRVGHTGTLDPFATGILLITVGKGTRLTQFLTDLDKEYLAAVRLGFSTDTQDLTGRQITPLNPVKHITVDHIRDVIGKFMGPQLQLPPMFSAKKVNGERLHKAARAGREVERQPVPIIIKIIEMVQGVDGSILSDRSDTMDFNLRVCCSSGTYIRTLANDIGTALGTGAHLAALRRTAVGRFQIIQAISLEELENRAASGNIRSILIRPADAISHLPFIVLEEPDVRRVAMGREVDVSSLHTNRAVANRVLAMLDQRGELVGIGILDKERAIVKPKIVIHADD